ncbi:MAG: protein-methionine-sulfoxide reductase heme-binding subunit MsrQ [Pseudomonadota bacterium]
MSRVLSTPAAHGLLVLLLCAPLLWLGWAIAQEALAPGSVLGADPADAVVDYLGHWSLRLLLVALAISPLRRLLGVPAIGRFRRTAGLIAFGTVVCHLLAYALLLNGLDLTVLVEDLTERRYIIAGMVAVVLLIPLAVTSTRGWQRRLRKRWQTLHRLVFPAMGAALLHLFWLTKDGFGEPLFYAAVFAALLIERIVSYRRRPTIASVARGEVPA